jgi:DNA-binding CsgD family transcriptional regulator
LLREAVHDSLLPGEQVRGHVGCAEAIEAEPGLVPAGRFAAEVAYHWYRAHRPGEALAAAWQAAEAAESARAYAEQMAMLARVLEFWEAVPEAADTVGADHTAVLEGAVGAALHSGEYERGVAFASAALGELDTGREPLRAAILLQQRGTLARNLGRPGGSADLRAAARLTEAYPNSTVRARVLGRHAQLLMTFEGDDPVPLATEALRIARRAGDGYGEAHALNTLACVWFNRGEVEAAFSAYARSQELARQTGSTMLLARAATNLSDALEGTGDYQRAIEVASRGRQEAAAAGIVRTQGAFLALNVIGPLVALGRWDEAMEILEHAIGLDPPPTYRAFMALWRAEVALPRGDLEAAGEHLRRARAVAGDTLDETQVWLPLVRLEAEVAAAGGEHETALAMLTDTLERAETSRFPRYVWPLLSTGARLVADTGTHTNLLAAIQRLAAELTIFGTVQPAHRALAEAETARAQGRNEPRLWDAALQAWQAAGEPYRISYTAYRAGEAAIAAGQRTKARAPLRRAATIAADLHAQPLGKRIDELAHRARVPLADDHADAPAPATGTPFGLTARETDVLQLLAAGHSNGQIASALFISPKTASVHVSNILAKLKVETRGAAAAMARDRALV